MNEIWKTIDEYPNYQVSNLGRVKNIKKQSFLKPYPTRSGYLLVSLYSNKQRKCITIHRLVAEHFIPNPENKPCIDHINTDRTDNRIENLKWVTYSENMKNPETQIKLKNKTEKKIKEVLQFDLDMNFISRWDKIRDIENELKISHNSISYCCKEKYKTAGGFKWGYADDYERIPFKVFDLTIYRKKVA